MAPPRSAGAIRADAPGCSLVVVPALPGLEHHDALRLDAALLALLDEALGRVAREPAQREAAALAVADRDHALGWAEEGRGAGRVGGPQLAPEVEVALAAHGEEGCVEARGARGDVDQLGEVG